MSVELVYGAEYEMADVVIHKPCLFCGTNTLAFRDEVGLCEVHYSRYPMNWQVEPVGVSR